MVEIKICLINNKSELRRGEKEGLNEQKLIKLFKNWTTNTASISNVKSTNFLLINQSDRIFFNQNKSDTHLRKNIVQQLLIIKTNKFVKYFEKWESR